MLVVQIFYFYFLILTTSCSVKRLTTISTSILFVMYHVVDQLVAAQSRRRGRVLCELNCRTRTANVNE
ncbi:unnamed protein product [Amoebophrya sp. A25]|nr:unnamed protein product [Amoebophrya sp. A25]|eukprot:GSA25T00026172001.1